MGRYGKTLWALRSHAIEPMRAVGKSQLYSMNTDADLVKALGKARDELR